MWYTKKNSYTTSVFNFISTWISRILCGYVTGRFLGIIVRYCFCKVGLFVCCTFGLLYILADLREQVWKARCWNWLFLHWKLLLRFWKQVITLLVTFRLKFISPLYEKIFKQNACLMTIFFYIFDMIDIKSSMEIIDTSRKLQSNMEMHLDFIFHFFFVFNRLKQLLRFVLKIKFRNSKIAFLYFTTKRKRMFMCF